MSDLSGLNLKEPQKTDWDNFNPQSKFQAPPPAIGPDGRFIVYMGQAPTSFAPGSTPEGLLSVRIDPITIVKSGNPDIDGYVLRFTDASLTPFKGKDGQPTNTHKLGTYLRACGIVAKPQTNAEYMAAVKQTAGKVFPFVLDWKARNKDTGEEVVGYKNFPDDPDRPGQKKAILKAGDTYLDSQGMTQTVKSEVMFANARLRYYRDPNRK